LGLPKNIYRTIRPYDALEAFFMHDYPEIFIRESGKSFQVLNLLHYLTFPIYTFKKHNFLLQHQ